MFQQTSHSQTCDLMAVQDSLQKRRILAITTNHAEVLCLSRLRAQNYVLCSTKIDIDLMQVSWPACSAPREQTDGSWSGLFGVTCVEQTLAKLAELSRQGQRYKGQELHGLQALGFREESVAGHCH
jgi:hypothetical protein